MFILIPILIIVVICIFYTVRIVPQTEEYVIEFLGRYKTTWSAGIHFLIPFFERVACKATSKEQCADFEPQSVITKDNVSIYVDTVVYFKIFDSKLFAYGAANPLFALENLAATTLRNLIGDMTLDEALTSRDTINVKLKDILDEATDPWGINVSRVELKNIDPPTEIKNAMEKQMKAEREKREKILQAEAFQESEIKKADGEAQAMIKRAQAKRDADIAIAQGKAKAIELTYNAESEGLKRLKEANVDARVVQLKSFDALQKVADGKATKIIVPTSVAESTTRQSIFAEMLKTPIEENPTK
ncbi:MULTISPECIES: SPFH domain-containing protein [Faecalicoccus]|uniref:SPFH/Band 7/PHB domain protein n=1 Tax=Faecalicoccus pleomorphus TaxID=1323 RepID=A0AAW6CPS8_9FIRM|nr:MULTISPECIES: SPFH domain-containing protein [Faecalicoccus]MCI6380028.1 SPFH/Band 7/PHB domain protein [Erysipelotrichaceae bacterium]MDB7979402.1 SPFH/Band 7/PHB domain protein [Faecalicoccus pleomorphus]MDB7981466.1 SPFH/Band 7/PHB domain protein [Faecalicoccus pleomorphus]MDY4870359.1 SPFH domain-containing protein [Faecalicoccus sp.]